jgi:hypothetical protein
VSTSIPRCSPPLTLVHGKLLLLHWLYSEGREQRHGGVAHKMWWLAGALRRNASDADPGVLETRAIFLRRAGGRHEGAHWVHMCAATQLPALARQYGNHITIYYMYCAVYAAICTLTEYNYFTVQVYIRHVNSHLFSPKPRIQFLLNCSDL